MTPQIGREGEPTSTILASVGLDAAVHCKVLGQIRLDCKLALTGFTLIRFNAAVSASMTLQIDEVRKSPATLDTLVRLYAGVYDTVLFEVCQEGKRLGADLADVRARNRYSILWQTMNSCQVRCQAFFLRERLTALCARMKFPRCTIPSLG